MRRLLFVAMLCLLTAPAYAQTPSPNELPADLEPITAANVDRLESLGRYGRGYFGAPQWTPDGETLIVDGSIGTWLYDPNDLNIPPTLLEDHTFLAGSPDGDVLTQDADFTVRLWSLNGLTATEQAAYQQPRDIGQIAFLDEGEMSAAGIVNGDLHVWDVATGSEIGAFTVADPPPNTRYQMLFSPDGSQVAVMWAANDCSVAEVGGVSLFDLTSGETVLDIDSYQFYNDLAFSPDGRLLAVATQYAGGRDTQRGEQIPEQPGALRLYDTVTGAEVISLDEGDDNFRGVEFSPDGSILAGLSDFNANYELELWNTETLQAMGSLPSLDVIFSPDSSFFISRNPDANTIWSTQSGETGSLSSDRALAVMQTDPDIASYYSISPDAHHIASTDFLAGGVTLGITLYDSQSGYPTQGAGFWLREADELSLDDKPLVFFRYIQPFGQQPFGLLSNGEPQETNSNWVIFGSERNCPVYESDTRRLLLPCTLDISTMYPSRLVISPNLARIAAIYQDMIAMYDTSQEWQESQQPVRILQDTYNVAAFSPDGTLFLYQSNAEGIWLIETDTGDLVAALPGGDEFTTLEDAAFSPDGSLLAYSVEESQQCGDVFTSVRLWDVEAGAERFAINTYESFANVELSNDGSLLVVNWSGMAHLYDTATGEELIALPGSGGVFSTDGRVLYVYGRDARAELWSVPTRE